MNDAGVRILARIVDFDTLRLALNERKIALSLRNLDVDEIAGLQTGYTGKILCGVKRPGEMSLPALLGALGVELALVPSPHGAHRASGKEIISEARDRLKKHMSEKGKRQRIVLTEEERRKSASRASRIRWAKHRREKREKAVKASHENPKPNLRESMERS